MIRPTTLADIVRQLNKCVINSSVNEKYEFDSHGVLVTLDDSTILTSISSPHSSNIDETKMKMQKYLENNADTQNTAKSLVYNLLQVIKYRTNKEKGLILPDESTPRGNIVFDGKLAQVVDILIELN